MIITGTHEKITNDFSQKSVVEIQVEFKALALSLYFE